MKVAIFDVGQTLCQNNQNFTEFLISQSKGISSVFLELVDLMKSDEQCELFGSNLSGDTWNKVAIANILESTLVDLIKKHKEYINTHYQKSQRHISEYIIDAIVDRNILNLPKVPSREKMSSFCKNITKDNRCIISNYACFQNVIETLKLLQKKGIKLVICSNTNYPEKQYQVLKKCGLLDDIKWDKIIIASENGPRKPNVEILQPVKDLFPQVKGYQMCIIGDMLDRDVLCGINAQIRTIWYTEAPFDNTVNANKIHDIHPDFVCSRFNQIPYIFDIMDSDCLALETNLKNIANDFRSSISQLPSSKLIKVGYLFSEKKQTGMCKAGLLLSNSRFLYSSIVCSIPLESQGTFDIIILSPQLLIAQGKEKELTNYELSHPKTVIIDPIERIKFLFNRKETNEVLEKIISSQQAKDICAKYKISIFVNSSVEYSKDIHDGEYYFVKPSASSLNCNAHILSIVGSKKGMEECVAECKSTDLQIEKFVKHSGALYKVYSMGGKETHLTKPSIAKLPFKDFASFNSQVPFPKEWINSNPIEDKLSKAFMEEICTLIYDTTKVSFMGIDIIIEEGTNHYYLIDANYMTFIKKMNTEVVNTIEDHLWAKYNGKK